MKKLFILFVLSTQIFATGSLECASKDKSFFFEGTTGHILGAPLIGDTYITVNGEEIVLPKAQIVNYWNDGKRLGVLALDENVDKEVLKITAKWSFGKMRGKAVYKGKKYKVTCGEEIN